MRAVCVSQPGVIDVVDAADPAPEPGEVVVEMHYASICGSDVHIVYDGLHDPALLGRPGYPGHEGVGVVVASRSERFPVGSRVLTTPPGAAGGCFAEFQRVGERRLLMAQQLGTTVFLEQAVDALERARAHGRGAAKVGLTIREGAR